MIITTKDLELKQRQNVTGAYLFFGEEEYLKRHYLQRFREKAEADKDLAAFNHTIIDGGDLDALEAECSGLALFAESRLIELRDLNIKKLKKDQQEAVCDLLSSTITDTIFSILESIENNPDSMELVIIKDGNRYNMADVSWQMGGEIACPDENGWIQKFSEIGRFVP